MRTKILLAVCVCLACLSAGQARATLYFPHADITEGWQTNICIVNTGNQNITGTLKAYSDAGQSMISPATVTVQAHERKVWAVSTFWPSFTRGYFVFETFGQTLAGYTEFAYQGQQRAAIPATSRVNQGDLYLFHIDNSSIWWTGIALVNTTTAAKTVDITFNNGTKKSLTIPANGHVSKSLSDIFKPNKVPEAVKQGYATISKAAGVIGLALFGQWPDAPPVVEGMKNFYLEGIELKSSVAGEIVFPQSTLNENWWTGIDAYNPTDVVSTLTIQPYSTAGAALDDQEPGERLAAKTVTIQPKSKYVTDLGSLNLPAAASWLSLKATTPITGFVLYGSWDGYNLGGYNAAGITARTGILPKIDGYTNYYFVNPGETTAHVTYSAYSDAGVLVAQKAGTIGAHGRIGTSPAGFFSPTPVTDADYLVFESDVPLSAFSMLLSGQYRMLECIPALVAEDPVELVLDQLLNVVENPDNTEMLSEILSLVMSIFSNQSVTCPTVTPDPQSITWSNPPNPLTFTIDFGNGCQTSSGDTMAGSATVTLTDFHMTLPAGKTAEGPTLADTFKQADGIGTGFSLTCNNIRRNGVQVLNGSIGGSFNATVNNTLIPSVTANLSSTGFVALGRPFVGEMAVTATNINIQAGSFQSVLTTLTDLWLDQAHLDGTVTMSGSLADMTVVVKLTTNEVGAIDLTLHLAISGDTTTISGTGTLGAYGVSVNSVVYNSAVCAKNPTSGSIVLTKTGEKVTVTFKNACSPADFYDIVRTAN